MITLFLVNIMNFIEKTDKILLNNKKLNGKLKVKYKNNAIYFNTLKKFEIILSFKNGEIDIKNILMNFEDLNLNLSGFIAGTDYNKLNFIGHCAFYKYNSFKIFSP